VVSKPGASGTIGVSDVINSKPDGYKILYLNHNYFATTIRSQKISFDPNYIIPLMNLVQLRESLGVSGDSPWKTLDQLLDYGRKNPGKIRHAIPGRGAGGHILDALLYRKAGVKISEVAYSKGALEMVPPLLGGHIDSAHIIYSTTKSYVDTGKIRLLVNYNDQRWPDQPDIPCSVELGYPTFSVYQGIFIHKDTPEDIKKILSDTFKKICEDPEFSNILRGMGDPPRCGGPEFSKEEIRRVEEIGVPFIKELGLYVGEPPKSR
jgi:tripartite-type tricarboxylate transporter receptor subunit TctC